MRPEELIATVLKEKRERQEQGRDPSRVVMSMDNYRAIRVYHAQLGEVPEGFEDYIGRYRIFSLPIYIDNSVPLRVE